ncbi:MAG: tetratricopeptide repeat protein [Candidatus Brocadiaceae bacterium]|nr:tetratricopeptide repeat protein [Candidatus Brocadiaceae bacterium]
MNINKQRLLVLCFLNILIVVHIILWYSFGYRYVGTFSLNGIVSLFGTGLLNSAAVFFLVVVFVTILFGRLFCGWGCHFAFFQELALKILNTIGITPKIIHSRSNIIQYVFLLKTLVAIYEFWLIYGPPQFHISMGGTQVVTIDLPRNPIIILFIIVFDAFLLIYLMGSRAFCRFVCPWAPLLAVFDNFSPWRIRKVSECHGCMTCTKSCIMGIPVQKEIAQHSAVTDANCIRCMSCKNACPNGTLSYTWGLNALSITRRFNWLIPQQSHYNWHYDFILIFCGLIFAYYTQKILGSFQTFLGAAGGMCYGIFIIRRLEKGEVLLSDSFQQKKKLLTAVLITFCTLFWCWGTSTPYDIQLLLRGNRYLDSMEYDKAIALYKQAMQTSPANNEIRASLALSYKMNGDYDNAIAEYKALIRAAPENSVQHNNLGTVYYRKGNYELALEEYRKSIELDTHQTAAYGNIGLIFLEKGDVQEAIPFLKKVFPNEEEMLHYILTLYKPRQEQNRKRG